MAMTQPEVDIRPKLRENGPYFPNEELGLIVARHMNTVSGQITGMTRAGLGCIQSFSEIISRHLFPLPGPTSPTLIRSVCEHMIAALITWFGMVLMKEKLHIRLFGTHEGIPFCVVVFYAVLHLNIIITDAVSSVVALEAGILVNLLKGNLIVCHHDDAERDSHSSTTGNTCRIFKTISKFLVYPSVLHQFLSSFQQIKDLERLEAKLEASSGGVLDGWRRLKEKALALKKARRT
ncbi:hypothetical protein PM082_024507 [Marasmius tenuissimus]|nr:hypothetical protein PM082_024507 [Marasmius tenuissimus]